MEKASQNPVEMSMEEWEILPDNTSFLEFGLEDVEDLLSNEIIYSDYFREQPKLLQPQHHREKSPAELLPDNNHENYTEFKDISISHVFFKLKPVGEEDLMDMKASSPKHRAAELLVPQPPPAFALEFTKGAEVEDNIGAVQRHQEKPGCEGFGVGICRWRPKGIGALCSMGAAAAATIIVVVLGSRQQRQHSRQQQNHMLQLHIHADNKGLTQVVEQARRLNQALAAARGTPTMMRTAKISFGRYYDGI